MCFSPKNNTLDFPDYEEYLIQLQNLTIGAIFVVSLSKRPNTDGAAKRPEAFPAHTVHAFNYRNKFSLTWSHKLLSVSITSWRFGPKAIEMETTLLGFTLGDGGWKCNLSNTLHIMQYVDHFWKLRLCNSCSTDSVCWQDIILGTFSPPRNSTKLPQHIE